MKHKLTILLLCILLTFTACGSDAPASATENTPTENATGNTDDSSAGEDTSTDDSEADSASDAEPTMEDIMIENSLLGTGNNYRLKQVIAKARAGEDVTLAFIGGSITEGYNAGTSEIFAKIVYDFFCENYGTGDNVHYVNAGLSGTPSSLGLLRSDRDLFAYEPDLIFIEFAVNDGSSITDNTGFESLVYKALSQENDPAVILLISVVENGYTRQDSMNLLGFRYELTRIGVKPAIWPFIEDGTIAWSDWSNDGSHPNTWGHAMYASFIIDAIKAADAAEPDPEYELSEIFLKGYNHSNMVMIDRSMNMDAITLDSIGSFAEQGDLESFDEGWKYTGSSTENNAFTFTYTGRAMYITYKDTPTGSPYGSADVYVDGEYKMSLHGSSDDGWHNPVIECIFTEKEAGTHTVEIRMNDDSLDKDFSILALGLVP